MSETGGENASPDEESLSAGLRRILRGGERQGAIIRGERGSGKRHAVDKAIVDVGFSGDVYRLSGTRYGRNIEYGALHFLLIDLEEDQITSPVIVFGTLRQRFEVGQEPPIFILENLAYIDAWSTTVLAQLAQARVVRLFVLDDLLTDVPEDILGLVRSCILSEQRVLPLSVPEVDEIIAESTKLKPSSLVTSTLWAYSEGNAEWLHVLLQEFMEIGALQPSNGALVMSTGPLPVGQRMKATALKRIEGLTLIQHAVIELVAGWQSMDPELLEGFPQHEVDDLYTDGILEFVDATKREIRLSSKILEDCLRAVATSERNREPSAQSPRGSTPNSRTSRSCDKTGMPQLDNVLAVLPEMIRAGGSQQALGLVTQVREEACGVLLMNAEAYPQAVLLSDHALELLALELRLAMRTGNDELVKQLVMVLEPIRGTIGLGPVESRELHEATASLLEAIARANRGAEAKVLVDWLTQVCLAKRLQSAGREPSPCLALTLRALLTTCLTLGNWEAGAKLAGFIREGSVRDPGLIAFAESINGMLLAATGDFESARGILFAAEQQLLVTGPPEEYEAVAGALAYCHAELHQNGNAVVTLTSGASHIGTDTPYGWVAEYFRALAMGKIHSHEAGRSRLRALERISSTKGEVLSQIHSVAALVRMGDHEAAVRLSSLCKNTEGSFPQAYARLADGVLEESGPLIVEALLLLIDLGFAAFALGEGNTIHELLSPAQRRQVARSVNLRRFASGSSREEAVEHFGEPKPFDLLTKRERFVASAAASGLSNLEIAEKASVSVRTVEGHLYQIYSKLTIRGRTELHNMAASLTGGSVESNA